MIHIYLFIGLSVSLAWAQMPKSVSEMCLDVSKSASTINLSVFDPLNDEEGMAYIEKQFEEKEDLYRSFILLSSPSVRVAEMVTRHNLIKGMRSFCQLNPKDHSLSVLLQDSRTCMKDFFSKLEKKQTNFSAHLQHIGPKIEQLKTAEKSFEILCQTVKFPKEVCGTTSLGFTSLIAPSEEAPFTTVGHEVVRISTDARLVKLSEKLYFYLLDLFENAAAAKSVKGRDIFSDLLSFFMKNNYSKTEARQLSLYFLGVYGTRGASFYSGFSDLHPASQSTLVMLSLVVSYLDKIALEEGGSYAIPRSYKNTCHLGKPYHFWLSAFISSYAQAQGYSKLRGYFTPVINGIAYDISMDANGRDIKKLFSIKTPFDYYANMTRLDNFSRALGAHFGKHRGKPFSLNTDEILADFFQKARMPRKIPKAEEYLEEYFYIIRPEALILRLAL
jgi:hypothetical protein